MRAWLVRDFGPFRDKLELADVPRPVAEKGSALIRVRAAGVNFPDALVIAGTYQVRPARPFTPGFELVGDVVQAGDGCAGVGEGDRVICWTDIGAFKEYVSVRPEHILPVPRSMTDAEAAAFLISYQTAIFSLIHRAKLRAGEVLLVHAAAGAVGSAAVQLGKAFGATVIAAASNSNKEAICRGLGADYSINYSTHNFVEEVLKVTDGRGADVILDPVGGEVFGQSLRCIASEGRIIPVGFASGNIPSVAMNRVLLKNISIVGFYWGAYWKRDASLIRATHLRLNSLYEQGLIRPLVGKTYKMEELPKALADLSDRNNYGKNVITMF
ncbi:MAG TPA: NADPH:quinone oxidoreductase family protein [Pyrinomonadaceae bacterium]|nr:NADPH:quinone oxidoreductase family protein [Pyrinomonadaceae bacterium]